MRFVNLAFLVLAAVLVVPSAQAVLLLGNLANGQDGTFGGDPDAADEFTTGLAALSITDIDVMWGDGNGGTANRVGIFTDAGGLPSGTQVGTWFVSGLATTSGATINYIGSATLAANTTYHLAIDILDVSRPSYSFNPAFFSEPSTLGAANALGSSFGNIQTVSWEEDLANLVWQLNGNISSSVPEPAALALMALGLLGLGWKRRALA